jgi:uncharacterized protein YndB with AHSA1/START domain
MSVEVTQPSDHEIRLTRVFHAPRALVFAAHTRAEYLKQWWGRGNPLDVEIDLRPGGSYRFVEHAPDGESYAFRGEFREVTAPERIVQTFEFEGMPGHVAVETLTLHEQDDATLMTSTTRFDTTQERDGMLATGMVEGTERSFAALDRLLGTLR